MNKATAKAKVEKAFGRAVVSGLNRVATSHGPFNSIYAATKTFPKEEMFGLTSQLRRASVSVASNIAEGQGRLTSGECIHFLGMARGSVLEVQTQLELAQRLQLGVSSELEAAQQQTTELIKILNAVLSSLRSRPARNRTSPN